MSGPSHAAAISLTPSPLRLIVGEIFSLAVNGAGFDALVTGGSLSVLWDTDVLLPGFSRINAAFSVSTSSGLRVTAINLVPGRLDITATSLPNAPPIGPDFVFAQLEFVTLAVAPDPTVVEVVT
ncbi:MAG: hypothetical protein R3F42_12450 [Pseudomonadota bacterium]